MFAIGNVLVSSEVLERCFLCDLKYCGGACCIEGDSGAPLLNSEIEELKRALPVVWNDLSAAAKEIITQKGVACIDQEGEIVTNIVKGRDCIFTNYTSDGICLCAIEKAWHEGKLSFRKPVSCHLYPLRVKDYGTYFTLNYDRWKICRIAETIGRNRDIRLYQFLKEPLIRRFGENWYKELELTAQEWEKQKAK